MNNFQATCCPICYYEYDQFDHLPRLIFQCGHTICSECIEILLLQNEGEAKCPLDQKKFPPNCDTVDEFPVNYALSQLIEERSNSRQVCPEHNQEMKMVCLDDKVRICEYCLFYEHAKHNIKPLKMIQIEVMKKKNEVDSAFEKLEKYNQKIELLIFEKQKDLFQHIQSKFDHLRCLINKQEQELLSEMQSMFNQEHSNIFRALGGDSILVEELDLAREEFENIQENCIVLDLGSFDAFILRIERQISGETKVQERLDEILQNTFEQIDAPLQNQIDYVSKVEFPSLQFREKLQTDLPLDRSQKDRLFDIKCKEGQVIVSPLNKTEIPDEEVSQINDKVSLHLQLNENSVSEEHIQALFSIFTKIKNLTSLKVELLNEDGPDVPPKNYEKVLENIFPLICWRIQEFKSFGLMLKDCSGVGDKILTYFFKEILSMGASLEALCLDFSGTEITDKTLDSLVKHVFVHSESLSELELDLSYTDITNQAVFSNIDNLTKLALRLGSTQLDSLDFLKISNKSFESFEMDLSNTEVSDETLKNLFEKIQVSNTLKLKFTITKISDPTLDAIGIMLQKVKKLDSLTLDFTETRITDLGLINILNNLPFVKHLELCLAETFLTDESIEILQLTILRFSGHLTSFALKLDYTGITGDCINNLFNQITFLQSLSLDLRGMDIGDTFIEDFATNILPKMQVLESLKLNLFDTCITEKGTSEFFHLIQNQNLQIDLKTVA